MEYATQIKSCTRARNISEGRRLHGEIMTGDQPDRLLLQNLIVEMYGKCGDVNAARQTFESIENPNTFSWNLMIAAYTGNGNVDSARRTFEKMPMNLRDVVTWNSIIAAYAQNGQMQEARSLFDEMEEKDSVTWSCMISAYGKRGQLREALEIFHQSPCPNVVAWNAILSAHTNNGHLLEARCLFDKIPSRSLVSWNIMISAYSQHGDLREAKVMFDAMPLRDVVSWNSMLTAYAQNGRLEDADMVFEQMPERNVISWNAMLAAFSSNGNIQEAKKLFDQMPAKDTASWNSMITGYAHYGYLEEARSIFNVMPVKDSISWSTIISAYAQKGHFQEAGILIDQMPHFHNVVSWTAVITAYLGTGQSRMALNFFMRMDQEGVEADKACFVAAINACGKLAALEQGRLIHQEVQTSSYHRDTFVGSALVAMYGCCARLNEAQNAFEAIRSKNVVCWGGLINAYAQNGHSQDAMEGLGRMSLEGIAPDEVVFLSVISSCGHSGMLQQGLQIFCSMIHDHGLQPGLEHNNCVLDLIGRTGLLREAANLIRGAESDHYTWNTMLNACGIHGDLARGLGAARMINPKFEFKKYLNLAPNHEHHAQT